MKKKWSVVVAVVVIILLAIAIVCTVVMNNDKEKENNSDNQQNISGDVQAELPESVKVGLGNNSGDVAKLGEFEVENIVLKYEDGYTFFKGDIKNRTEVDYPVGLGLEVTLLKGDAELIKFPVLTSSLNAGDKSTFESKLTIDCSSATDVKIDLVEN